MTWAPINTTLASMLETYSKHNGKAKAAVMQQIIVVCERIRMEENGVNYFHLGPTQRKIVDVMLADLRLLLDQSNKIRFSDSFKKSYVKTFKIISVV